MPKQKLWFTAPLDFDPVVWAEYRKEFKASDVRVLGDDTPIWVCNPKAHYIIDDEALYHFPNLRILATPSTGTNHIDLDACQRRGVKVLSLLDDRAGLETISASAEFTFKLLLDALRIPPAHELQGKFVGLIGFGRIGQKLHHWLTDFGATITARDPNTLKYANAKLSAIFEHCDAVIICCALTDETCGMITKEHLLSMKQGAVLVNTARAEIINEQDLLEVLKERHDIRFATDVLHGEVEGRLQESAANIVHARASLLHDGLNAILTPHIAGETFESRTKAARIILNLLKKELTNEQLRERGDVAATALHALATN